MRFLTFSSFFFEILTNVNFLPIFILIIGNDKNYMKVIFPTSAVSVLNVIANVGLIAFMFIVGLELDPQLIKKNVRKSVIVSSSSRGGWVDDVTDEVYRLFFCLFWGLIHVKISVTAMICPFALGLAASVPIYQQLVPPSVRYSSFLLFIAVALSITAVRTFP